MGRNGPPWQSVGTPELLGNRKVNRSAGAKPNSHTAATGDAGRTEPCARCSGTEQEFLRWGACSLGPPVPRQPRSCLQWAAERAGGDKPCFRLPGALGPCLAPWRCVMGAETGLVLPL